MNSNFTESFIFNVRYVYISIVLRCGLVFGNQKTKCSVCFQIFISKWRLWPYLKKGFRLDLLSICKLSLFHIFLWMISLYIIFPNYTC